MSTSEHENTEATERDASTGSPAAPQESTEREVHQDDGSRTPPHGDDKPPSPSSGA